MSELRVAVPVPEGFTLEARLDGPEGGPGVVVCHPHPAFGGTMDTPVVEALARGLAVAGMRVLRFNFRGIGGSGGEPEGGLVEERDVRAACAFLRAASPSGEVALVGYSFGALMVAKAIAAGERTCAWVGVGFPTGIVGDVPDRVAAVRAAIRAAPVLLVAGSEDQFCELASVHAWSHGITGARIEELPGVGHFPTGAALEALVARVVAFLRAGA